MNLLAKSKLETWLPFFFLKMGYSSLLVSNAYLQYKQIYSVLVVANEGVLKFLNTVEVKTIYHSVFVY